MYIVRYTLLPDLMMTNGYSQGFYFNLPNTIACECANTNEEAEMNAIRQDRKNGEGITAPGEPRCRG
jgi:hypothetical protein